MVDGVVGKERGRALRVTSVPSSRALMAAVVRWFESLPLGFERRGVVLCGSALLRHRIKTEVAATLGRPELLFGVKIMSPSRRARLLLAEAGEPATGPADALRRLRLRGVLGRAEALGLGYFDPAQLSRQKGYVEAFARTIGALEEAGLEPAELRRLASAFDSTDALRVGDVAEVWERVCAKESFSETNVYRRATQLAQPSEAPCLVVMTQVPRPCVVRLLEAMEPDRTLYLEARPTTASLSRRLDLLEIEAAGSSQAQGASASELGRLQANLFSARAPAASEPDGSVEIELYASLEEELEAVAGWVVEEIHRGTRLARMAVVVPRAELLGGLLVDRLSRAEPPIPVCLAGGRPRQESPAGVRVLALVDALASGLEAEATLRCLPWLCPDHKRLGLSRVSELVYGAGILGGTARDLSGGLEWSPRLSRRHSEVREEIIGEEAAGVTVSQRLRSWLEDVGVLLGPIRALEGLLGLVSEGASFGLLAEALLKFCDDWLQVPESQGDFLEGLRSELEVLTRDGVAGRLSGVMALLALATSIKSGKVPEGRLSEGVFVGTAQECAGVEFDAVRFMGMSEGVFPRLPPDDPVLPSSLRRRLEVASAQRGSSLMLRRMDDVLDDELQALFRTVCGARHRLSVSMSRQWVDRTERAPSGVVLELAYALGVAFEAQPGSSALTCLETTRFGPGVDRLMGAMLERPSTPKGVYHARRRRFESDGHVPPHWLLDHQLEVAGVSAEEPAVPGSVPGLSPDRPLSPSWLGVLLSCPYRFLQEKLLGRAPIESRPPTDRLEPRVFGTLIHDASEAFFLRDGARLCRREGALDLHLEAAREDYTALFQKVLRSYPLRGGQTRQRELERGFEAFRTVVTREWERPTRSFEGVEIAFGFESPLCLEVGGRSLYLRGRIDRIDRLDGGWSVRDLKTGRGRSLAEEGVNLGRDLQLGVYAKVVEEILRPDAPVVEAAYTYSHRGGAAQRAFVGEGLELLGRRTQLWLEVAVGLLEAFTFPKTTSRFDCTFCPFLTLCGGGAAQRSAAQLCQEPEESALGAFWKLREASPW